MKRKKRTFIIPLIATGTLILGLICLFLPFLPFGWFLIIMTALLLTPYFKPMKKLLAWVIEKDKSGIFEKARKRVAELYHWAGDKKKAREMNEFHNNSKEERAPEPKKEENAPMNTFDLKQAITTKDTLK